MNDDKYKQCPNCGKWFSLTDILTDPALEPLGMTLITESGGRAFFFFEHAVNGCHTSLALDVSDFAHLIDEPIPDISLFGRPHCPGHCAAMRELLECRLECYLAPFRRLLVTMIAKKSEILSPKG